MSSDIEQKFRDAKALLASLTNNISSAERGIRLDLSMTESQIKELVSELSRISQGVSLTSVTPPSAIFSAPFPLQQQNAPYPSDGINNSTFTQRISSSYLPINSRPSELQRRKAEGLLTELRQAHDYLSRLERRNAANVAFTERKKEILGENFSSTNFWSPTQGEMELEEKERKSLEYLNRRFAHMEEESRDVLSALKRQGHRLAQSNSKVGSVLEAIGLGDSTLGRIVRRNNADALIVYVGIFFLFLLMWKIWSYRKS